MLVIGIAARDDCTAESLSLKAATDGMVLRDATALPIAVTTGVSDDTTSSVPGLAVPYPCSAFVAAVSVGESNGQVDDAQSLFLEHGVVPSTMQNRVAAVQGLATLQGGATDPIVVHTAVVPLQRRVLLNVSKAVNAATSCALRVTIEGDSVVSDDITLGGVTMSEFHSDVLKAISEIRKLDTLTAAERQCLVIETQAHMLSQLTTASTLRGPKCIVNAAQVHRGAINIRAHR